MNNVKLQAGTNAHNGIDVDVTTSRQTIAKPTVGRSTVRDCFKLKRIDFIKSNVEKVISFTNGSMSKKERCFFANIIKSTIGYSKNNNTKVLIRIFKNSLEEINFTSLINEL
jgi:hypothetical protein